MFTGWVTTMFTLQLNVYTVAISSVNKIVINEWLRLNNSGFLMSHFGTSGIPYTWCGSLFFESSSPTFNFWWSYYSNETKSGSMFRERFDSTCTFMSAKLSPFIAVCTQYHAHLLLV